jgi:hypothetical protein
MTKQLTPAQIKQLRVFLADYGLNVTVNRVNSAQSWKPKTPAGRKCKARMLMWAGLPPIKGVSNYQVRGVDGQWYAEWMDGFQAAVAYQKAQPRPTA